MSQTERPVVLTNSCTAPQTNILRNHGFLCRTPPRNSPSTVAIQTSLGAGDDPNTVLLPAVARHGSCRPGYAQFFAIIHCRCIVCALELHPESIEQASTRRRHEFDLVGCQSIGACACGYALLGL